MRRAFSHTPVRDKAKGGGLATISRWSVAAILAFVCVTALIAMNAMSPYLFKGATLEGEVAAQLRASTGLRFSAGISGRFDLLPRPHVVFYKTHVADPRGTIDVDAEEFDGDVRLLPLIVGRVELSSVTLIKPRLMVDLDGRPIGTDSFIGRALHARPAAAQGEQRLGTVALVDGTATIKGKALPGAPQLEAVNVTLDWSDLDSPATLTGSLSIDKTAADIAAWIAQPSSLLRGDHSAVTLNVHTALLDLYATGDLASAMTTVFGGHLSAKSPSGATLLALFGSKATMLAPFANLSVNSDVNLSVDPDRHTVVDFPNLTLRADGNQYEGTLAFQSGARPSLSGTLASGQLMLAPFLDRLPALQDQARRWSAAPILGQDPRMIDLDLRVSATHVRLAPFTIDDAALAVMTRADRTEVALVEGKAYGGAAKGRMSVGISRDGVSLRGTGSIDGADASTMIWDALGRQLVAGTFSGSFSLETIGDSPATLMRNLQGWAKGSGIDGEISGIDLGGGLRAMQRNNLAALQETLRSGRTPFRSLTFAARVNEGVATFDEGAVQGQDIVLAVNGRADCSARRLDLRAVATPAASKDIDVTAPRLAFKIDGPFGGAHVEPDFSAPPPAGSRPPAR